MESGFCSHWRKSWHQVLGLNREARIPPCNPLKGDSLNSRAVWPLVGVGDLAPDAISVNKSSRLRARCTECRVGRRREDSLH